jgi:hypothetical protein
MAGDFISGAGLFDENAVLENKARCRLCGDVVESTHRHDFRSCSCGAMSVDGGHAYVRRSWDGSKGDVRDVIEELSVLREEVP